MSINPYEPPRLSAEAADSGQAPVHANFKLFSPGNVAWATFLGSPLAGCFLLAINYWRLGDAKSGWATVAGGVLGTAALMVIGFFLPDNFPNIIFLIGVTFGMLQLAKALQGGSIERHVAAGGRSGSGWVATGIGLLTGLVLVAVIFGVLFSLPDEWFAV